MPLSEKAKNRLLIPFAISPILKWCALPGLIGMVLIVLGVVQKVGWLKIVGLVLAAPVIWCYLVVVFIFFPFLVFDRWRRGRTRSG